MNIFPQLQQPRASRERETTCPYSSFKLDLELCVHVTTCHEVSSSWRLAASADAVAAMQC